MLVFCDILMISSDYDRILRVLYFCVKIITSLPWFFTTENSYSKLVLDIFFQLSTFFFYKIFTAHFDKQSAEFCKES